MQYNVPGTAGVADFSPQLAPYQVNQTGLSLDVNSLQSTGCTPAITDAPTGSTVTVTFGGTPGGRSLGRGAQHRHDSRPSGRGWRQVPERPDLEHRPERSELPLVFGGLWTNAYGNVSVPATCPAVELDLQLVALDATSPDGVRVSQVVGLK